MKCIFRFAIVATILFTSTNILTAQVKVGDNISSINSNSVLELESTNKGLLLPRLTTAQINAMTNVPKGMLLFNITDSALYIKRDTGWAIISIAVGNNSTQPWVYNGSNIFNNNNVGIGTNIPKAKLHVQDSSVVFAADGSLPSNTSANPPVTGTGRRMMWYADKAAFRTGAVAGDFWDRDNIGNYSFATGYNTSAKNILSVAFGDRTVSNGATSTAMGTGTISNAYSSTVIGAYNDNLPPANYSGFDPANRIFEIGNGYSESVRKNAVTVLYNGNVGIAPATPTAKLHLEDGSVVFNTTANLNETALPVSGAGTRMLWYANKGAFRSGRIISGNYWDKDSIGYYSFAAGVNTMASNIASVALGESSQATGSISIAIGNQAKATKNFAISIGYQTTADGLNSTAVGQNAIANEQSSVAIGKGVIANYNGGIVVGTYNDSSNNQSNNNLNPADRLFQIGNGSDENNRGNAVTVLRNGYVGLATTNPKHRLDVGGNIRQKTYSFSFTLYSTVNNVMSYYWNHNLGYKPIIMTSLDQTNGQNCDYVGVSYSHIDDNSLYIIINNHLTTGAYAIGTLRWIIVY